MNKQTIKEFTDLNAWKEAHRLMLFVYKESRSFPKEEMFGLTSQIRRASLSVTSNIAEGFGRRGLKEKIQFYYLAQGSITEVKNQLIAARDLKYLSGDSYAGLAEQANVAHKLLQGLITATKKMYSFLKS